MVQMRLNHNLSFNFLINLFHKFFLYIINFHSLPTQGVWPKQDVHINLGSALCITQKENRDKSGTKVIIVQTLGFTT